MGSHEGYIVKGQKKLRLGYTTGSCSAAVAKAGVKMLLSKTICPIVELTTVSGRVLMLDVGHIDVAENEVTCSIQKDGGDDPDITHGILIYGKVRKLDVGCGNVFLSSGQGIGIVTEPGLPCKVGEAAINPAPKKKIISDVLAVMKTYGYSGDIHIELSIPGGEALAKKTFNPRLGIKGGLSILGTTGIVEPMSEKAFIDTIKIEIDNQLAKGNERLIFCSGNYGKAFGQNVLGISLEKTIKYGNYIGDVLDYLSYKKVKQALFISHIGKIIKVAAGIMNTWSKAADGRMEILVAHSGIHGATKEQMIQIMNQMTTDGAITYLEEIGILNEVKQSIMEKILKQMRARTHNEIVIELVVFSANDKIFGLTAGVEDYVRSQKEAY